MHLISNTLLEALTQKPQHKLSNDTVDAIIELSQSGSFEVNRGRTFRGCTREPTRGKQLRRILKELKNNYQTAN